MRDDAECAGARIHGTNTDGIFYTPSDPEKIAIFTEDAVHPNGEPIYALKVGNGRELPAATPRQYRGQRRERSRSSKPWRVLEETDPAVEELAREAHRALQRGRRVPEQRDLFDQLADVVILNGGGMITGPAGTGKTELNRRINARWRLVHGGRIVNTAITHVASRLMPGGQTLAHVLHRCRYGQVGDHVFCVDEIGQIPLSTWGRIGQWQLVGAKFVLMGDFDGQFEPIYDAWRGDVKNADILRQLADGLHVRLTTGRRSDQEHFRFYTEPLRPPRQGGPRSSTYAREPLPVETPTPNRTRT
jgi:hypothetical protein